MITKSDVLELHQLSIQHYGGASGVRDEGLLESAIARPFHTFNGADLYPTGIEKAAAIFESLLINHPFVDGNKRAGFLAMFAVLELHNMELTATQDDAYSFTIAIASGQKDYNAIVAWLQQHTSSL